MKSKTPQHRLSSQGATKTCCDALGDVACMSAAARHGFGRGQTPSRRSTSCSSMRPRRCRSPTCSRCRRRRRRWCCIGDPQQLDQPMQGSHPEGTDVSALDHILRRPHTRFPPIEAVPRETWRLHPEICAYTSELFYDGKLHSRPGLGDADHQSYTAPIGGAGLRYLPVEHTGNQNSSARKRRKRSAALVEVQSRPRCDLDRPRRSWRDRHARRHLSSSRRTTHRSSKFSSACRAQPGRHGRQVPGAGSADRDLLDGDIKPCRCTARHGIPLQPQPAERRNSRAPNASRIHRKLSPSDLRSGCRTPRQMQLANAFCRYLELAQVI